MRPFSLRTSASVIGAAVLVAGCSETPMDVEPSARAKMSAITSSPAGLSLDASRAPVDRVERLADAVNAVLAAGPGEMRLTGVWMFTVGRGLDPYRRLRTGARWPVSTVEYILDASDYTGDLPPGDVDAVLEASYDRWNEVARSALTAVRGVDDGGNHDVLDGIIRNADGDCISNFDVTSPNLDLVNGLIFPESDIVVGGWLPSEYFTDCLGNSAILGVTFSFSAGDVNSDNYVDRLYVEQYYNEAFQWVTSGSEFLDPASGVDLASIATHEDGHSHGLGHFGGPNHSGETNQQPFFVRPNGKVFTPEAVMNPGYLFGEKYELLPTDEAALSSVYGRR